LFHLLDSLERNPKQLAAEPESAELALSHKISDVPLGALPFAGQLSGRE
jgi:hypothetical protein